MELKPILEALQRIAPLEWAEAWDNVGLLIEPVDPRPVNRVLLTIDLTEPVLAEALEAGAELVVAYHPPIFAPLKRLTRTDAKQRIVLRAAEQGLAVYSPHTALDATPGGVNDFLADGLGEGTREPIRTVLADPATGPYEQVKLVVFVPREDADAMRETMTEAGAGWIGNYSHCSFNLDGTGTFWGREGTQPAVGRKGHLERVEEVRMEMVCPATIVRDVARTMCEAHPYEEPAYDIMPLAPVPDQASEGAGLGRLVRLNEPVTLEALIGRIKHHLGLEHVRLAQAAEHGSAANIATIALCAGAGGSVIDGTPADVYLTGEMRHHDALAAVARGTSVVLCEHSNTERPYLPTLRDKLAADLGGLDIRISKQDADPLRVA